MEVSALSANALQQLAINAAINFNWEEALTLNQHIIDLDPKNVDALNRMAKAYFETGKLNLAKKYYTLALEFDQYNPIAQKNLKIIQSFKKVDAERLSAQKNQITQNPQQNIHNRVLPSLFLQEPGKTKMVNLLKVAEPQKLSLSYPGMSVEILVKNRKITVLDGNNTYLGILPDDLSHLIIRLLKGGNKYQAFVKSVRANGLTILIRETFRSKRFHNQPSFPEQSTTNSNTTIMSTLANLQNTDETQDTDNEEIA